MTIQWDYVPWPVPSEATVKAVLDRNGYGVFNGQIDIPSEDIAGLSDEDNQIITARGWFGNPLDHQPGADFAQFSGVATMNVNDPTGQKFLTVAWEKGDEIGRTKTSEPSDTVAFWESLHQ